MFIRLIAVLVTAGLVVLGLAGRDDESPPASPTASVDPARYCDLSRQLDQAGAQAFRKLEHSENASPQDFKRAEASFVRRHAEKIDEVAAATPPEIDKEAALVVSGIRARAGLESAPYPRKLRGAERTVKQFERENCSSPQH